MQLQAAAARGWAVRWWAVLSVAVQDALAATILQDSLPTLGGTNGCDPTLANVLLDSGLTTPDPLSTTNPLNTTAPPIHALHQHQQEPAPLANHPAHHHPSAPRTPSATADSPSSILRTPALRHANAPYLHAVAYSTSALWVHSSTSGEASDAALGGRARNARPLEHTTRTR